MGYPVKGKGLGCRVRVPDLQPLDADRGRCPHEDAGEWLW